MERPTPLNKQDRERAFVFYRNGNPAPTNINGYKYVAEDAVQHARNLILCYEATVQDLERQLAEKVAELGVLRAESKSP